MHRLRIRDFAVLLSAAAALVAASPPLLAQIASPRTETRMPSDIDPTSGFRLPLLKREDLDEAARKTYDSAMTPGETIVGLRGPAGIQLYSPRTTQHLRAINRYLRFEAGISPRIREIAILATARELDSQFEWVAHEPEALKEGVPQAVIDVIKYRKSTDGLEPTDAAVIDLGRELWRDHKVKSETFAKLKATFGPHKLVDLVLLMGNYAGTAALLSAVDMQLSADKQPLLPIP
jgi:4-carboxymuconolactone decarboxylase